MKKMYLTLIFGLGLMLVSCGSSVTVPIAVTSNPVGNKVGTASYHTFLFFGKRHADVGINAAAKNGGITKISHVDQNSRSGFLNLTHTVTTRVYGE